jgi:quercetin dioxygenase-like cupin family protein
MLARLPHVLLLLLSVAALRAQAPETAPGITVTPVLDNPTMAAVRLKLAPGAKEQPHTHPYPLLVIVLKAGEMEMHNGQVQSRRMRKAGDIEYVAAGVSHSAANGGAMPIEALAVSIKMEQPRGGTAPAAQAQPGVTRTPLLDRADIAVTRLEFEADVREPVHTHPYDLLFVPTAPGRLDVQVGDKKNVRGYGVGEAFFVPRNVPHAVANVGTSSLRLLSVRFK